jgi:hypothetical protein
MDLVKIAEALCPLGALSRLGERGLENLDQHGDDADDHEQFNQRKSDRAATRKGVLPKPEHRITSHVKS